MIKTLFKWMGISFLFLILGIISTYPLISHFDSGIPFSPTNGEMTWNRSGDQLQLLYMFWLAKENILGLVPFNTNPFEFNFFSAHESRGFATFPLSLIYLFFSIFGSTAAYNCTLLTSYVLAGIFTYLLVHHYTKSRTGALVAALLFTFAPSRINGVAGGNEYALLFFSYPWILYGVEKAIEKQKMRYGVFAALGFIGVAMLEIHLLYYIAIFLAVYLPVRFSTLLTDEDPRYFVIPYVEDRPGWQASRSILFLLGIGVVAVFYCQAIFHWRDQEPFFTEAFPWIICLYPLICVFGGILLALVLKNLFSTDINTCLSRVAKSLFPLILLAPLSLLLFFEVFIPTDVIVYATLACVVLAIVLLPRGYYFQSLKKIGNMLVINTSSLLALAPFILSVAFVVIWIPLSKISRFATTNAASGRSIRDVKLFSPHIPDMFINSSNVYLGILPVLLILIFLLILFWKISIRRELVEVGEKYQPLFYFYVFAAFLSYVLSLGLAFGKSSLYLLFYHYFPFFNYPRVSDRIVIVALFSLAIVIGFLIRGMQDRIKGSLQVVFTILLLGFTSLQLKDYNLLKPFGINTLDKGQDIYTHVKNNIGDGLLLEIPLWPGDSHQSSLYQHNIMNDRVPRVNGYSPIVLKEYVDLVYWPLDSLNQGSIKKEQYDILRELGVEFITVHNNKDVFLRKVSKYGPLTTVRRFRNSPYLEFVDIDNTMYFNDFERKNNNLYLFKVKNPEEVDPQSEPRNWYILPEIYDTDSRLYQRTGEKLHDDSLKREVFWAKSDKHVAGYLVFGPYSKYPAGKYTCSFNIRVNRQSSENKNQKKHHQENKIARIEVAQFLEDGQQTVIAQKELYAGEGNGDFVRVELPFSLQQLATMEFRVFYYGTGEVKVEQIMVYEDGGNFDPYVLRAEKMPGETGEIILQGPDSNQKVIEARAKHSKRGKMVYGPHRLYPKGQYTARFYLKSGSAKGKKPKHSKVAVVSITDEHNSKVFAKRSVSTRQLNASTFTGVDVDLHLLKEEELSFNVKYLGKKDLQLDRIELVKQ